MKFGNVKTKISKIPLFRKSGIMEFGIIKFGILASAIIVFALSFYFYFSFAQNSKESEEINETQVYVCPLATSLEEVNPDCECRIDLSLGKETTKECNGKVYQMSLGIGEYEGKEYYLIYGFENGGAGVFEKPGLETQIEITKLEYGGKDILNEVTQLLGDKKPPLLLSELKEAKINLEEIFGEGGLGPGQKRNFKIKFKLKEDISNEYQGESIDFNLNFLATH